ncbi:hypothetical protein TSUD_282910 [Trifolium subterraneum]|uniref:Reverse transcriptase domain-containing protein n=1 Tax=Trifolium subterraneum TaxID=3900 RepID=A0A2Z6PNU2_TRISU|nr:hypothetical protein TSUD_282910 [Trifolium subterraneum]
MREFGGFIDGMGLVDLPLLGRRYTWFHPSGRAISRIDRVLVSLKWLQCWGQSSLWILPRDVSDHCPLLLKRNGYDWGPKPFRFNNAWLEHKDFNKLVEEVWRGINEVGWMGFILKEKLKGLKVLLKAWHKVEFGGGEKRIAELIEDIKDLDIRGELVGLSEQARQSKFTDGTQVGDVWLESPLLIRDAVVNYFEVLFSSIQRRRPLLNGVQFPLLSEAENLLLARPFSDSEISYVVRISDGNKSPGPNGFNFAFLKNCWDTIKGEVRIMFDQFHGNASLPMSFLSYFVALIPKKTRKEVVVFKVDFVKAYDSVDWGFLEYMLRRFGFCDKWIDWLRACVFVGSMSILANGSPTREIDIQRGLMQGDPLASFLFLSVAEGFGGVMRRVVELDLFKGFMVGRNGFVVSHLQYAGDTLCIGEASSQNLWTLKAILRGFEMASGLKINFSKSCLLGVNVTEEFLDIGCSFLNCKRGEVPFKYLGLPVGANPRRLITWEPLLEQV